MASKTQVMPHKEELLEPAETSPDHPLLDLSDAAVKKLIRTAKKRGYVTHDQINSVLRSEAVNSEQMEDVLAMLGETGINVVEAAEAEPDEDDQREEAEEEESAAAEIVEVQRPAPANVKKRRHPSAPTIWWACICKRCDRSSCSPARARSPSRSASRPAARR